MAASMTREKGNVFAGEPADNVMIRRRALRRVDRAFFLRLKSRHGVESAAADNSDFGFHS